VTIAGRREKGFELLHISEQAGMEIESILQTAESLQR